MRRSNTRPIAARLLVLAAVILSVGCNDNGAVAPAESDLSLSATPSTIVIDTTAGAESGESRISARLYDANGFPSQGYRVDFEATSGTLSPVAGDPTAPLGMITTDPQGTARVYLTLSLTDAGSADVTARAGSLADVITVDKTLFTGNAEPEAIASVSPPSEQQKGRQVQFSGRGTDPDSDPITCYRWEIVSPIPGDSETFEGPGESVVAKAFSQAAFLSVVFRVSDDQPPVAPCTSFSSLTDSFTYEIVCDLTDPVANAGPTPPAKTLPAGGGTVSFVLDGSGSTDPDSPTLSYNWTCADATPEILDPPVGSRVQCTYDTSGSYRADLTVTNECGLTDTGNVTVVVRDPVAR